MSTDEEAQMAVEMMNGKDFGGRTLTVNEARPMEERPRGGGGGGYGGGNRGGNGGGGYGGASRDWRTLVSFFGIAEKLFTPSFAEYENKFSYCCSLGVITLTKTAPAKGRRCFCRVNFAQAQSFPRRPGRT